VKGTFSYGAHPTRVYAYCANCKEGARLEWKDTYGRTMNRVFFGIPFVFTLFVTIGTIVAIILIYFPF